MPLGYCYICGAYTEVEFCRICNKNFCAACRRNYPVRISAFMKEAKQKITGRFLGR